MRHYPAYLYLFDLLYLDHYDVTSLPLEQRKRLLRESVRWTDGIRWTEYTPETGTQLFQDICHQGGKGSSANSGTACMSLHAAGIG